MSGQEFPELACYGLAGHSESPRDVLDEVLLAERLGIGSMLLSERFNVKDAGVLAAASRTIGIGTAATNHNTRHPLVTATMAATAHRLSGGRYALGLGRGFGALFEVMGLPKVTSAQLRDVVDLYRRLWRGEAVLDHRGPAGEFPYLQLDPGFDERIPVMLAAIGDRTLELTGEIADGVVLHTFFTDDTLARAVRLIRSAAERAGRDPASVRVWSVLAVVPGPTLEDQLLRRVTGRLATYLQGYGDVLVRANGWDPEVLRRFREDPLVAGFPGAFDAVATAEQLAHLRDELIPGEWLAASAVGTPRRCAERIADQFAAGADGVVLHGATPAELTDVLAEWRDIRVAEDFCSLPVNPGRIA